MRRALVTLITITSSFSAAATSSAPYQLIDHFAKDTFFGNFTAFSAKDPTNGFVSYQSYSAATTKNLIKTVTNANDASYLTADPTNPSTSGRDSIRISSVKSYNKGLFILDLLHMPNNTCGSWPAFWLLGPDWPNGGEIDILEGANNQQGNQMTLHTSAGCSVQNKTTATDNSSSSSPNTSSASNKHNSTTPNFKGTLQGSDCGPSAQNTGCAITSPDPTSYGSGFNAANGGVYATEWTSTHISIWFFPRSAIPASISSSSNPDPLQWGPPSARFAGCDIDSHFKNMNIVFNTAFCGDWAGRAWESSGCKAATGYKTCQAFVGGKPDAFREAFWLVNYVKVFQKAGEEDGNGEKGMSNGTAAAGRAGMVRRRRRGKYSTE